MSTSPNFTLLLLYLASGVVLALVAIPLMFCRIPPNPLYGFRVRQTLNNRALWYLVNCYSGRQMYYAAIGIILSSVLFSLVPDLSVDAYAILCLVFSLLLLTWAMTRSMHYLRKEAARNEV
jgi:hypothetical protein